MFNGEVKRKLEAGEIVFGSFVKLDAPAIAELYGIAGFDFVILDAEHGCYTHAGIENMIDMPERTLNNLLGFLRQNDGKLSKRARESEFANLTADEVEQIEELYRSSFLAKGGDATA